MLWMGTAAVLLGQHGSTEDFIKEARAYRAALGKAVTFEQLTARWVEKDGDWFCKYESPEGQQIVNAKNGKRVDLELGDGAEGTKLTEPAQGSSEKVEEGKAPEGDLVVVAEDRSSLTYKGETYQPAEGWKWNKRVSWSPDQAAFLVMSSRDVSVRRVHYIRSSPENQLQPEHFTRAYPKPGDELVVSVPVAITAAGKRYELDPKLLGNPFSVTNVEWRDDDRIWMTVIERGFDAYKLLELNVKNGKSRIVAAEEDDKFVHAYDKCGWWDLGAGKLLWRSEASGHSHLYVVDEKTGRRKQITSGQWVVRGVRKIEGDEITFLLGGFYPEQDPYHIHYARVNWRTGKLVMLTHGDGTHYCEWSPDGEYYTNTWSRIDSPPVHELRRTRDGGLVTELGKADASELLESGFQMPERFTTGDRDNQYQIHGVIWKPRNFDPNKKYAVIESIYAGPHGSFTPKNWATWQGSRSDFLLNDFVVVKMDGRGTNHRGKEFQQYSYKNIKDSGFPDRIKWIRDAAKDRPWMDLERVGIYGGSAGGQSTLAALIWHNDFYHAGAADCGCHDNRMDKIWWNEQWMDFPVDESYAANSNTEHVAQMEGDLFLTVGEVDTNVDPSSTLQVLDALVRADKNVEFYLMPNGNHGVGEVPYLRKRRIDFFERNLGGPQ